MLFKELVQDLGLGGYQMLPEDGIVHHLHVCFLARLLLIRRSLERPEVKARRPNKEVTPPPMGKRLAARRAEIARDRVERFVPGEQHARLRQKLCEQLLAA